MQRKKQRAIIFQGCPYCPHKARQETQFENIPKRLMSMTLYEIAAKFGDMEGFERYVNTLKTLTEVDERDQALRDRKVAEALLQAPLSDQAQAGNR
jgi:hypothetical protein